MGKFSGKPVTPLYLKSSMNRVLSKQRVGRTDRVYNKWSVEQIGFSTNRVKNSVDVKCLKIYF